MGNWNRRWQPRRKNYQEVPPSPPRPQVVPQNSMLSWEQKFCYMVGSVPWQKVVVAKRYMYCHDNVVKWNDTAAEEAFHNAKKRFWAQINGLHCDIPLPDPDMYIDEVDWNPDIDPKLMLDLDRTFFNPDERNDNKERITNQKTLNLVSGSTRGWDDTKHLGDDDNPWEGKNVRSTGVSEDIAKGLNQWDATRTSGNVDNLWEQSCTQDNGTPKNNLAEGCGDMPWNSKQRPNSNNLENNCENPWERDSQSGGSLKQKGWGEIGNNSWGNIWGTSNKESRNLDKGENPWVGKVVQDKGAFGEGSWGDCGDRPWGWKQQEKQNHKSENLYFRNSNGGWGSLRGSYRKREGSYQQSSRSKTSRFRGDDSGPGHIWKNERTQKTVTFGF